MRRNFSVILLGLCLTICGGQSLAANGNNQEILIGMSGAFSGTSAKLGEELLAGMQAYFDYTNEQGGVNGRKIALKVYDDGYNPGPAIENTLKLINQDKVFALMGYIGTPTVTRVLPVLEIFHEQYLYLFFPFTGAQPQRQPPYNDHVYNLRPSYRQETKGLVDNLVKLGKRRIAVFYQADAYGRSGWDGVRRALAAHGLEIVDDAAYRRGQAFTDSYAQHVQILRDADADAVISIGSYAAAAGFIRDARDSGWQPPIANVSFVNAQSLLALLLKEAESSKIDYTSGLINSEVVPNYRDTSYPAVREYRNLMTRYAGDGPVELGFVSLEGYFNARLMVAILARMGENVDRARIDDVMRSLKDYEIGIDEKVSFEDGSNQGLQNVYFNHIVDDDYEAISDWSVFK